MPIPLVHEDDCDLSYDMSEAQLATMEDCHFCMKETRFWHAQSNTPVCPACARQCDLSDLPRSLVHDPAYDMIRKMSRKHIDLRARDENLEIHEANIRRAGGPEREIAMVQRQRLKIQRMMKKAGLPVKRVVSAE